MAGSPPQEYDERPAQAPGHELGAGGADPSEQEAAEEAPSTDADPSPGQGPGSHPRTLRCIIAEEMYSRMWGALFLCTEPRSASLSGGPERERPPEGWPGGLPLPEPLSAADAKEADDISELLGPYVAAALYSRHWQLREAALLQLVAFLGDQVSLTLTRTDGSLSRTDGSLSRAFRSCYKDRLLARVQGADKQQVVAAFPAATRAIQRAIKERVPNVLQAGLQVRSYDLTFPGTRTSQGWQAEGCQRTGASGM